jgi:hypothetical protein
MFDHAEKFVRIPDPGGTATRSKAKGTGKEQGGVESPAATDDIRCNSPE